MLREFQQAGQDLFKVLAEDDKVDVEASLNLLEQRYKVCDNKSNICLIIRYTNSRETRMRRNERTLPN